MSKLLLPTGLSFPFDLSLDKKYYIVVKRETPRTVPCDGCNGEGKVVLADGGKYRCPKCGGDRVLHIVDKGVHYCIKTLNLYWVSISRDGRCRLEFTDDNMNVMITNKDGGGVETELRSPVSGNHLCSLCDDYSITDNIFEAQTELRRYEAAEVQND